MWKKLPDHFFFGLIFGVVSLFLSYLVVRTIRIAVVGYYGNEYVMAPPRVQLFAILINVIIFRFFMIRFDKEKTARGILFSTVILSFVYFFLYFKYNYMMR